MSDILDAAVDALVQDDWNHIPEATLRERLEQVRETHIENRLLEAADRFIAEVRENLSGWSPDDPEYGR